MRIGIAIVLKLILVLMLANTAFGQEKSAVITGTLIDINTKETLPYTTVAVYRTDSTLVDGAITDFDGAFRLEVEPAQYYLEIQSISYELSRILVTVADGESRSLGTITMRQAVKLLEEVMVTGEKNQMRLELDKRIFNVGQNINNVSLNAADILDNLPSINVDVEGNVSLRGNQNVRILVDGKPSGLVGISGPDALRMLQGDLIESVEVITNPSARYDAEGTAGIINIILKKQERMGFNGSFNINGGLPVDVGISTNFNYKVGKFNFFANYGIDYDKRPGGGSSYQKFTFPDTTYVTYRDQDRERGDFGNSFRFGIDTYITDNDVITASGLYRISDESNDSRIIYDDYSGDGVLLDKTLRLDNETEDDQNSEFQLVYRKTLPGDGHELAAEVQFRDNSETEKSQISESDALTNNAPYLFQRSSNREGDQNWLAQLDYVYPVNEAFKFEAGYRGTFRQMESDYLVEEQNTSGNWISLDNFSNQFIYDEDVNAGYAIFEHKLPKWGYQVGLRAENTRIKTYQRETAEESKKSYLNFFPSVYLTYKLSELNTIQVSYSRRLSRPRHWFLNPFLSFNDPRNIRTGNPNLDPEYTNSYEAGYLNNREKTSLYGGIYYRYTSGMIQRINYVETNGTTYSQPHNLGSEESYGIELNVSSDPLEWLNLNGNANFYHAKVDGDFNGERLSSETYTTQFNLSTKFDLGKVDLQLRGRYRAPENTTQGRRKSQYHADIGANWLILKGNGTISLNIRDLFNTRKYRGISEGQYFYSESEFQWRSRQLRITFTYRINQKRKDNGEDNDDNGGNDDMEFQN